MGKLTSIERKVATLDLRRGAPAAVERIRGGRLLKSAGISMDELTGEIPTDRVMACDCVETYVLRESR